MIFRKNTVNKIILNPKRFFGAAVEKPYDWRDDPNFNKDIYQDVQFKGWNPETYTQPYSKAHDNWLFNHEDYQYDLKKDLVPENRRMHFYTSMRAPIVNLNNDILHEIDFESEDLDFQPEEPKMQHFKKSYGIWHIAVVALIPALYIWAEFAYQHYPDEDHWKKPMPPPLDYPSPEDTPDTISYNCFHSREGKLYYDRGIYKDIGFDIIDNKKVYKRFTGVNQPMDII